MAIILARLDSTQISKIITARPVLEKSANITGIPWQMLAAVWFRESSLATVPPPSPGGCFQFDPVPDNSVLHAMLEEYTELDFQDIATYINLGVNNFAASSLFCACWLRHQCKYDLTVDKDNPVAIKDAFYGYNGRAYGPYPESSPYVYNEFDEMHHWMTFRGSVPDRHAPNGRKWITIVDYRPGAFTVYTQLLEGKV